MNKINRKVEYALIALKHMHAKAPGELSTAKEISQLYGCPFDVLARSLQVLAQSEILKSVAGASGGYLLVRDLSRLNFHELVEVLAGPVGVAKCLHESVEGRCEIKATCNIISPINNLNRRLTEFYQRLPVSELLETRPRA